MDIVRVFGDNVRKYRNEMRLSQEAFAEKCGLHRKSFSTALIPQRRSIKKKVMTSALQKIE